jgi:O-antigen ligase
MSARTSSAAAVAGTLAALAVVIGPLVALPSGAFDVAAWAYVVEIVVVGLVSTVIVLRHLDPAVTLSAAIFLTPFAGNWPQIGVPGPLSPDRLLLAAGILSVLLRASPGADRPRLRITGVHWLLALAAVYAMASALFAGTLVNRDSFLQIVDSFGVMPFILFLVAPLAFRTPAQRRVLLATLVALGAYLSLTVVFVAVHLDALVFPKYVLDPSYGIHSQRGRGPFADAVANGLACYACAVACAIAVSTWRDSAARAVAIAVGMLCVSAIFLSLERSVWIGAVLGTTVAMLARRGLRRHLVPMAIAGSLAVVGSLAVIPGFSDAVDRRLSERGILWDRQNVGRAALNMVEARPLFGFGWNRFTDYSADYFQQAFTYPLTASHIGVHNTPLGYAADLGLIGATLWLLAVVMGIGSALVTRGPPSLAPWHVGLVAIVTSYAVVMNSVPPTTWLHRTLWLFAGVVYSGRYIADGRELSSGSAAPLRREVDPIPR